MAKNNIITYVSIYDYGGTTIQELLDRLTEAGIEPKDYDKIEFQIDYSNCYYESDRPGYVIVKK